MAMLLPDWNYPDHVGGRPCFAAHDAPGTFMLLPRRVAPAGGDGTAGLTLDLFSQERGDAGVASFGMVTIRLAVVPPTLAERRAMLAAAPDAVVEPATIETGLVRLNFAQALAGTPGADRIARFDASGGATLATQVRLDGAAAALFAEALMRDVTLIRMDIAVAVRGAAARFDAVATVDLLRFAAGLKRLAPDGDLACTALIEALAAPDALGIALDRAVPPDGAAMVADALADRIAARFGTIAMAPDGAVDAWMRLDQGDAVAGTLRLDLSDAVLAPRYLRLDVEPLLPPGSGAAAIRRNATPGLGNGWHQIMVGTNLSGQRVGLLGLAADISAPPAPPERPATARTNVLLPEDGPPAVAQLRLAPGEPLAFDVTADIVLAMIDGAAMLKGPVRHRTEPSALLTPADLPVPLVSLDIDPALLAAAELRIVVRTDNGVWKNEAVVQPGTTELLVATPPEYGPASFGVLARSRATGMEARTPILPLRPMRVDGFRFDTGTVQQAKFYGLFRDDGASERLVECVPETDVDDPAAITLLRLRPGAPDAEYRWLPPSPFAAGFRWRLRGAATWSPIHPGGTHFVIRADEQETHMGGETIIDGVTLTLSDDAPDLWYFWPTAAEIARTADGAQANLIAAGPVSMVSVTTVLAPDSDRLERVRAGLSSGIAGPARISPAPIAVGAVELLLGDGTGNFTQVATAGSAGAPPWSAAFSLVLEGAQAAAAARAFAGERGWLAVRYPITVTGATRIVSTIANAAASAQVNRGTANSTESVTASIGASLVATEVSAPARDAVAAIQTDAADWGLPKL